MNLEEYILSKIAEEAVKVAQQALTAHHSGPATINPNTFQTNLQGLESKLNDLLGILKLCRNLKVADLPRLGSASEIDDNQRKVLKNMKIPLLNGRLDLTADQISSIQKVSKELGVFQTE